MKSVIRFLSDWRQIIVLLLAIGALTQVPRGSWTTNDASLSSRVDSVARNVDALIRLQCVQNRAQWDEMSVAGIPCARLVNAVH